MQDLSDEKLAALAVEAESGRRRERAFAEIYARYADRIRPRLRSRNPVEDRADDLLSVVFSRVYQHLHRYDSSRASFSSWIWTIASNLAKNELRNDGRRFVYSESDLLDSDDGDDDRPIQDGALYEDEGADPERDARRRRVRELLREEVLELPPHSRVVIVLREVQDRRYQEIANVTGLNKGTVKSRLHRARDALVDRLRERGISGSDLADAEIDF